MKTIRIMSLFAPVLFIVFLVGCLSAPPSKNGFPTLELTNVVIPSTLQPSTAPTNAIQIPSNLHTLQPTLSPDQENNLVELLQSEDCVLPCYLGITPGASSWNETQSILKTFGAQYRGDYLEGGLRAYAYSLWIGDPMFGTVTRQPNMVVGDLEINQDLDFVVDNNSIVQRIKVYTQTKRLTQKFNSYWSRLNLENILTLYGSPDHVFYNVIATKPEYIQFLVYENLGIVIETNGKKDGEMICPLRSNPGNDLMVIYNLTLTHMNSGLNPYDPSRVSPLDQILYLPIVDALGVTEDQFRARILSSGSSACFNIDKYVKN